MKYIEEETEDEVMSELVGREKVDEVNRKTREVWECMQGVEGVVVGQGEGGREYVMVGRAEKGIGMYVKGVAGIYGMWRRRGRG